MAKRKLFDDETSTALSGYLTDMSEVKTSANGKTKYFTGTIQTSKTETKRLVCFTPEKHCEFMRANSLESPVKLKNHLLKPGREGIEVHITKSTSLEINDQPLPFKKATSQPSCTSQKLSLKLTDLTKEDILVTVKVKFLKFTSPEKLAHTRFGDKNLRTAIVGDETGTITLTCWEKAIPQFTEGQYYKLQNLVTKKFDGDIMLNTTSSTIIDTIAPLDDVVQPTENTASKTVTVNQIVIKATTRCGNTGCAKPIEIQNEKEPTIRCPYCSMKQKVASLRRHVIAHLNCTEKGQTNDFKFVMFEQTIMNLLTTEKKEPLIDDTDLLEDFFLEIPFFNIEHSVNGDVIHVCSVFTDDHNLE